MKFISTCLSTLITAAYFSMPAQAQIDEDQLGSWSAYVWSTRFENSSWGLQGDFQLRNWDVFHDTEQYLGRIGLNYTSDLSRRTYQLGIASVTTEEFGGSDASSTENRIFQDVSIPQLLGQRLFLRHRFRAEQRWIETQDFRTRYRYSLSLNMPVNQNSMTAGAWYFSLSNEFFLNGERDIGNGRRVDYFDRNRTYSGFGRVFNNSLRLQFGYMHQWTDEIDKGQLQIGLNHRF